jgi:hypothetical protein
MLPRLLFHLAVGVSAVLIFLVVGSPALRGWVPQGGRWSRLLEVFAQDPTLRRTASAGAIGLVVTACVFFRQPALPRRVGPKQRQVPPPQDMAGA